MYLAFKEMRAHLALEAAWLPLLVIQRIQQEKIPGGLSGILAQLVKWLADEVETNGLQLQVGHEQLSFRFAEQFLFLSDMEAQRATWSTKGSAGLKPCMFCSNVTSKHALPAGAVHGTFQSIASAAWRNFCPISDQEFANAARHLAGFTKKTEREAWEKAYGLTWDAITPSCRIDEPFDCCHHPWLAMMSCIIITRMALPPWSCRCWLRSWKTMM